jgi:CRP/FNR family transcriptional regulator
MKNLPKSPYGLSPECFNCHLHPDNFFCSLSEVSLRAFDQIKRTYFFPEGAVICVEGQSPRGVFVLCEGRVKLFTSSRLGKTLIVRIAKPGEVFGLHAVVIDEPYELTVETMQPCRLSFVEREDFLQFLKRHGDASLRCAQQISRDCKHSYDVLRSISLSNSVSGRVAQFLLDSATAGAVKNGVFKTTLALTHENIAQLTGTSRETVSRTLNGFKKNEIAELNGSTLTIHNKAALERLATI